MPKILDKGIISKYDLPHMSRDELIEQVRKLGIPLPPDVNKKALISLIVDDRPPVVSHEGILHIARMIKFGADMSIGTGGAYHFLKMVYPDQSDEDTKKMARIIEKTRHDA